MDLGTGLFVYTHTDLSLRDVIPLTLTRTYRPDDPVSRAFGIGTSQPYDMFLIDRENGTGIDIVFADGGHINCAQVTSNWQCASAPISFFGATIVLNPTDSAYILTKKDGTILTFPHNDTAQTPQQEALIGYQDRYGNALTLTRDSHSNLT